jgi:hypothetical protein
MGRNPSAQFSLWINTRSGQIYDRLGSGSRLGADPGSKYRATAIGMAWTFSLNYRYITVIAPM